MSQVSASHLGWANAYIGYGFFFLYLHWISPIELSDIIMEDIMVIFLPTHH